MRLDRFITLNLVQPLRRSLTRVGISDFQLSTSNLQPLGCGNVLPVLMYHSVSDDPERGVRPYYRVCTSPQQLREQMRWLKDNGCRGVTLSAGLAWLNAQHGTQDANPQLRPVVITFDDGFRDFYTHAFPILQPHGFSATMYLPTAFIGDERRSFKSRECLNWAEVKELHRAGIEFGSHTTNHPQLLELSWSEVEHEIQDSKFEIEAQLGVPCATFAYPYAFPQTRQDFADRFKDLLMTAGYETCVTTQLGLARPDDDPMQIKRLPVNSLDDDALFLAKLNGSYDWLASGQATIKTFKRLIRRRNGTAK